MKKQYFVAVLAALAFLLVSCGPLDLSTLGTRVTGGSEDEEIVVYEADNTGQTLEISGPEPVPPIDG